MPLFGALSRGTERVDGQPVSICQSVTPTTSAAPFCQECLSYVTLKGVHAKQRGNWVKCSPGTKDLHTVSYKKPFRWGSSGSLSSRTFTGMNELQYIILSFPGMKKWWAGVGSIIKKKWKSPFVFYTSPRGPPFIRNRLDFLELPQASVAFTAGLHCTPSSRQPHSVPAFIERPSRLQKTHRCLIQMRRVAFWIMLRLPDNNHSSTWKQNACVSLWSLHRFLDLRLHREYHKFTCYLWKTDTALASLIYLKRGVRREKKKEKNNIFM